MSLRRPALITLAILAFWGMSPVMAAPPAKPKLVVSIIVDQFRYDYLTRFRSDYHGGFDQLLTRGADFTNAFYAQVPTITAVGHSIFMSGSMPAVSGIVGNYWYDRSEDQVVTSVCDWHEKSVGGGAQDKGKRCTDSDPASPRRLLVSTVGDELRSAHEDSKVVGVSIKARGAILPSGHRAAGAFWFDDVTGNFISSTFYMQELPAWAASFNEQKLASKYVEKKWESFPRWDFHQSASSKNPYGKLPASPWGNELIEKFAEQAVTGEKLGQRAGVTDLLTVSFSSNDYVGHAVGPDAPEVRDMAIRTDRLLGQFFQLLNQKVGMQNVIVVLSADHGVATAPSHAVEEKMNAGYLTAEPEDIVEAALNKKFGQAHWIVPRAGEASVYFNYDAIANSKSSDGKPVSIDDVYRTAREALFADPQLHVARVYTREQLDNGVAGDFIATAEMNGYFPRRSGDLMLIFEPGFVIGSAGTNHLTAYNYDRHVPVLFMGPGIKPGRYDETIHPNDIAPTLATLLDIQTPSGSSGRVLNEMIVR